MNRTHRYLVVTLALFSGVTNIFSQFVENSNQEKDRPQQQPVVIRPLTHPQGLLKKSSSSTRSFYKSKADWQKIIDSTWGPGLPLAQKLEIFDSFSTILNNKFDGFLSLGLNWDSLRSHYRSKIDSTTSRGRFSAIMSRFAISLRDGHTGAADTTVTFTPVAPGVPVLVIMAWASAEHFGAVLTSLPDSTALVLYTVPNHPLGLVPGDIILGYENKPWKQLVFELLDADLPFFAAGSGTLSSEIHKLMRNVGNNWHLFDTIDVLKYSTKNILHLSVTPLLALSAEPMWGYEQLPILGIPFVKYTLDSKGYPLGQQVSYGKLPGTNIGYIQLATEWPTAQADQSFYQAINALWNTEGLVIDMRWNTGGWALFDQAFAMMFSKSITTIEDAYRVGPANFNLAPSGNSKLFLIPGTPGSIYDKPIAVLLGPTCISMGDVTAQRLRYHPMVRFFGKPPIASLGDNTTLAVFPNWKINYSFGDMFHTSEPGVYLNRSVFPIDEPVWFNPDDVAKGKDPVLICAQDWMKSLSHIHDFTVMNPYVRSGIDSLVVTGILNNPANHTMSAQVSIINPSGIVIDSALMKNDGLHGDGLPGDSIWGLHLRAPSAEEFYTLNETINDQTLGSIRQLPALRLFTTAGPIVCNGVVSGKDPGWGESVEFLFNIRNEGKTAIVKSIKANFRSLDTAAIISSGTLINLADISPGQSQLTNNAMISFSRWSSGVRDIPIELIISSSSVDYWRDTVLIRVGSPIRLEQWTSQSSGMTNVFFSVSFTDANNGTTVGEGGVVLHTTNGGVQWTSQSSGTTNYLSRVCFTDANIGTIVGEGGTILRTTNGGTLWTSQSSGTTNFLSAVSFTDANNGTIVGEGGTILRTTDGGVLWTSQSSGLTNPLYSVSFTDANNGTVVGEGGTILRTTNGGAQWTSQSSGTTNNLFGVSFTDANNGTAVGDGGTILRTTNGGSVWVKQLSVITNSLNAVSFTDANNGAAVGYGGTILRTTNGGATWMKQLSGTANFLNSVSFTDAKNGVAVGYLGTILRTTTGGVTWAEDQKQIVDKVPTEYSLAQNYPNPFNPTTTIRYAIPTFANVKLVVYDLLGREITTLVNEEQSAGWKEVQWNASAFASGIYLVRMSANNFVQTKKVLLTK
ncbi:MAG: YCF48-related protein [Bacteroidota bacterium]